MHNRADPGASARIAKVSYILKLHIAPILPKVGQTKIDFPKCRRRHIKASFKSVTKFEDVAVRGCDAGRGDIRSYTDDDNLLVRGS